jgi:ABC-type phosphate/phosphonate transport system permease subunit
MRMRVLLGLYLAKRFTALFVTHSVTEAVFLSSRVVAMSARPGRVLDTFPVRFAYPRAAGLRLWGPPLAVLVAMLGLWYAVSYLLLDPDRRFLVPPPHEVVRVSFLDPYNLQELLDALWLSTWVAFLGLAVAIVIGTALAVAMSQARWAAVPGRPAVDFHRPADRRRPGRHRGDRR